MPQSTPAKHMSTELIRTLKRGIASSCAMQEGAAGLLRVTGADRLDLLHRLSTNALLGMHPGQAQPTVFTTDKGRIIDAVAVLIGTDDILLLGPAALADRLREWIANFIIMEDVQVTDAGQELEAVSVAGPDAQSVAGFIAGVNVAPDSFVHVAADEGTTLVAVMQHPEGARASIVIARKHAAPLLARLSARTQVLQGEAAEAGRIAFGIPAAGHELSEAFTPYDAGLRHAISFTKGCYVGQEVIARLDTYQKIRKGLTGVVVMPAGEQVPAPGPLFAGTEEAGVMTSVVSIGAGGIGLAVVRMPHAPHTLLALGGPSAPQSVARVVALPLVPSDLDLLEQT
jgi:folate-binding protein YgfZ